MFSVCGSSEEYFYEILLTYFFSEHMCILGKVLKSGTDGSQSILYSAIDGPKFKFTLPILGLVMLNKSFMIAEPVSLSVNGEILNCKVVLKIPGKIKQYKVSGIVLTNK